jgi:hypothetical protein
MVNENLDNYIQFLMDNIDKDSRISLTKKMKYGYRHYYLILNIDTVDEGKNSKQNFTFREILEIYFDNRNKCIEINSFDEDSIIIENEELLNKWNKILEEYINKDVDTKVKKYFEESLMKCYNKSLHREYQMKKIL